MVVLSGRGVAIARPRWAWLVDSVGLPAWVVYAAVSGRWWFLVLGVGLAVLGACQRFLVRRPAPR